MYLPAQFKIDDRACQDELIEANPLGTLISAHEGGIDANHVPFVLHRDLGEAGLLRCHLARANPQWKAVQAGAPILAVFQGVERYVTPSWYETKRETGKVVPTWNYVAVHVRGRARIIEDGAWLGEHVAELTGRHEGRLHNPWSVEDAPKKFIDALLRAIVGIEITIEAIEGKWKVSQNRPEEDRKGVTAGYLADANEASLAMAALVAEPPRKVES